MRGRQIVYYNDENGYAVLRLAAENGAEVTATGTFPTLTVRRSF
ncbi:MAG: hypothetical protein ACLT4C_09545 [Butyricicoccus sp.]